MIIYVVPEFPTVSQAFIFREVKALRDHGAQLAVFPLRWSRSKPLPGLLAKSRRPGLAMIATGVWSLVRRPKGMLRCLRILLIGVRSGKYLARQCYALIRAAELADLVRLVEADEVHLHAQFAGRSAEVAAYCDLLEKSVNGFSVSVHAADIYTPESPARLKWLLRNSHFVRCISEDARKVVIRCAPRTRTLLVHCGILLEELEQPGRSDDEAVTVVTVGRLVSTKGWDTCIEAASLLRSAGFRFRWLGVGDGPLLDHLLKRVAELGLEGTFQLLGAAGLDYVLRLVSSADVFVLPSRVAEDGGSDGIPVALMEAMALERPVISTPVAGIPELIDDGVNGLLIPPDRPDLLACSIEQLTLDPERRHLLAKRGRARVLSDFNVTVETRRLLDEFNSINHSEFPL
jgi:colanic acid/amylovoran biosynthesis glycosyltransferase